MLFICSKLESECPARSKELATEGATNTCRIAKQRSLDAIRSKVMGVFTCPDLSDKKSKEANAIYEKKVTTELTSDKR